MLGPVYLGKNGSEKILGPKKLWDQTNFGSLRELKIYKIVYFFNDIFQG